MTLSIQENVPLSTLTTFEIGGDARFFTEVANAAELVEALEWADKKQVAVVLLAGGSNVLVPDWGIDGLVVRIHGETHSWSENILTAFAGCDLLSLIRGASARGLGGWEKLSGIPGTIGGAVRGNAGAFGSEIKDFVREVRTINRNTYEQRVFSNTDSDFSYRQSFFKRNPEWIICEVVLDLLSADTVESERLIADTIVEREKRHLQNVKAAGSFFMNPIAPHDVVAMFEKEKGVKSRENRVPAGWLIEKVGMKGVRVGHAIASLQHPNYIVNEGGAEAQDVRNLAATIKQEVLNTFGIELTEEAALL